MLFKNIRLNIKRIHSFYNYTLLKEKVASTPLYINIDVTNACNYKCPMCPQSNPSSKAKRGFITVELFEKIISDVKEFMPVDVLCLFLAGEPLLNTNLELFVSIIRRELGIRPHIASNLALLSSERMFALIEAGLGSVLIDFCYDKALFEKLRKGGNWDDTYDKIKLIIKTKKQLKSKFPKIILKDISTDNCEAGTVDKNFDNLKSIFPYRAIDRFQKYRFHNWGGLVAENVSYKNGENSNNYYPCSHLWFNMAIQYDGRVSACCRDAEGKLIVGNVAEKSLNEIWNGVSMVNLRKNLIKKEYKNIPLCNTCDRLWTGGYFGGKPIEIIKRWIKNRPAGFRFILER